MTTGLDRAGRRRFWASALLGWLIIAVGVRGIFSHRLDTRPAQLLRFVAGGILIHDLLVAPLVILFGVALSRVVRGRARGIVQAALIVSAVIALFSYPLVRAFGKQTHNPTSLPHNYAANVAVVLGLVWAATSLVLLVRVVRTSKYKNRAHPLPAIAPDHRRTQGHISGK